MITYDIPSILYIAALVLIASVLILFQRKDDTFDLRDVICSWDGKRQTVSTSKTLLAGAFITSSYYVIQHPSEMAYAAYLLAWVTNGGIAVWQKTKVEGK